MTNNEYLTTNEVIDRICSFFFTSRENITINRRFKEIIEVRQIICHVLYYDKFLNLSYQSVGKIFNNQNHATVMHSIKKLNDYCCVDHFFYAKLKAVYLHVYNHLDYFPIK